MNRTEAYRQIAFENGNNWDWVAQRQYLISKAILDNPPPYAHNLRRAQIECALLDEYPVTVNHLELLVGRYDSGFVPEQYHRDIIEHSSRVNTSTFPINGFDSNATYHRVIDYEKLLHKGIRGILEELDGYLADTDENDLEKHAFYQASRNSLEAVVRFAGRYREALEKMSCVEEDKLRKAELMQMAANFARAPYLPCTHFYEAMQCMWFVQFCCKLIEDVTLTGRLDQYLYPYYVQDIKDGILTKEKALELIEQLYYKHNEIYNSWPASVMVGGLDRAGTPVCNELTYLCVEAIATTKLVNPSVAVCYTPEMPDDLLDLCMQCIADGYTRPSIFNDRVVREGLEAAGVEKEDANYYVHSTCVEITPIGSSNIEVATPYINLVKAFEYILGGGKQLYGDDCHVGRDIPVCLDELKTFDSFFTMVKKVAAEIIHTDLIPVREMLYAKSHYRSSPLVSAFLNDCLARGKDSGAGGAKYNFVYPCFPGFINLIDSLAAVKKAVYDEEVITLGQLAELCRTNFADAEEIRQYLLNCPKFGNDLSEPDGLGVELYEFIKSELKHYHTSVGGSFHPSYFAWIKHGELGKVTSATPDGRRQGEALSEHLGAVQGMDRNGPLSVMYSIEKLDQRAGIGGIATNYRFSKSIMGSQEGRTAVKNLIHEFMANDCFEIQFNVVNQEDLINAQKYPEKYRTLLVRVAGYSDYFVNLDPVIQAEIIKRSEHADI